MNGLRPPLTAPPSFAAQRNAGVSQSKIRPVAQILPSGSFAPQVNLVGVATPNPPMTGAKRRCCGAIAPQNFINLPSPGDCIFANSPGFLMPFCNSAIFVACRPFSPYIEDRQGRARRTDRARNFSRNFSKRFRWTPCFFPICVGTIFEKTERRTECQNATTPPTAPAPSRPV